MDDQDKTQMTDEELTEFLGIDLEKCFICYGKQCGNIRITPEDLAKAMYEEAPLKTSPYGYAWDELDSLGYVSFKIGQVKAAKRIMIKLGIE